jgi:hypothetical protein
LKAELNVMTIVNNNNLNQSGFTLYASFLPIALVIAIILGAGYFLMQGEFELPRLGNDTTEVKRIEGFPRMLYATEEIDKQREIIKSQAELDAFLQTVDEYDAINLSGAVNFDKEYLIAISTETVSKEGYRIKIDKLYENKDANALTISVKETRPGKNCQEEGNLTLSVDLAVIKKTDRAIDFDRVIEVKDCKSSTDNDEDDDDEDSVESI